MCARHRGIPVGDDERCRRDSHGPRLLLVGPHVLGIRLGGEDRGDATLVETALGRKALQDLVVVDGEALGEVGRVEALDRGRPQCRATHLTGEGAQPMGVEGVGAHGAVPVEDEVVGLGDLAGLGIEEPAGARVPVLHRQVLVHGHVAAHRHVRVQLEGAQAHADVVRSFEGCDGSLDAALGDPGVRAGQVAPEVELDEGRGLGSRLVGHRLSQPRAPARPGDA